MDYRLALLMQTYHGLKLDPRDLTRLISREHCGHPSDALDAIHESRARAHLRGDPDWCRRAEEVVDRSRDAGVRWSYLGAEDYPYGWYGLSCRPVLFSYRGEPVWREWPTIAVVGSRTPALDTCRWLQREFATYLATERVAVISGGARGVDQWAHRLALGARRPTVCVSPSGILNPYPPGSEDLWEEIIARGGCLLSTFPLREPMRKHNFAVRNRWIAGLSPVTFVVEANHRSGSWLTAQLAAGEERTVCTLPVSANATQGLANLQLILDGHTMIRDATDLRVLSARKIFGRSTPGAAQGIDREAEEHQVDQPQGDPGG